MRSEVTMKTTYTAVCTVSLLLVGILVHGCAAPPDTSVEEESSVGSDEANSCVGTFSQTPCPGHTDGTCSSWTAPQYNGSGTPSAGGPVHCLTGILPGSCSDGSPACNVSCNPSTQSMVDCPSVGLTACT